MRDPPKLVVDEWEYGGQGFVVAGAPVCQEFADGVGRKFWHPALQRNTPKSSTITARNAAVYLLKQRHFDSKSRGAFRGLRQSFRKTWGSIGPILRRISL
jgi:hypothetical protein